MRQPRRSADRERRQKPRQPPVKRHSRLPPRKDAAACRERPCCLVGTPRPPLALFLIHGGPLPCREVANLCGIMARKVNYFLTIYQVIINLWAGVLQTSLKF